MRTGYATLFFTLLFSCPVWAQPAGTLTGTVTDESGEPLAGVNVLIRILDQGAITDAEGRYTIQNVPPGRYEITFRFIGYQNQTDSATVAARETKKLDFILESHEEAVEEIVVPEFLFGLEPPRVHLWDRLEKEGGEESGYAMYTYVLLNRHSSTSPSDPVWARYRSLVKAIQKSTPFAGDFEDFSKEDFNLFLIPSITDSTSPDTTDTTLNGILSGRILTGIAIQINEQTLRHRLASNPGPFLISSLHPISNRKSGATDLLYVDLTNTNPAAMSQVVATYKKRIIADEIAGIEQFRSMKLALLNFILDADDHIRIVKTASAEWLGDD